MAWWYQPSHPLLTSQQFPHSTTRPPRASFNKLYRNPVLLIPKSFLSTAWHSSWVCQKHKFPYPTRGNSVPKVAYLHYSHWIFLNKCALSLALCRVCCEYDEFHSFSTQWLFLIPCPLTSAWQDRACLHGFLQLCPHRGTVPSRQVQAAFPWIEGLSFS